MLAADQASAALGIEVLSHGDGCAVATMTIRPEMRNGYEIAHGGIVFSLADTAFACACNSSGRATLASGADIVFVAPLGWATNSSPPRRRGPVSASPVSTMSR